VIGSEVGGLGGGPKGLATVVEVVVVGGGTVVVGSTTGVVVVAFTVVGGAASVWATAGRDIIPTRRASTVTASGAGARRAELVTVRVV